MKQAIEQRYRMLPYIYSAAEESARTGTPIMRPLFLEFPRSEDAWLAGNQEEFMFGPAMLVAPKVWEFNQPYEVQLPVGTWYDYWTGATYQGGQHDSGPGMNPAIEKLKIRVNPKVNELPVYVKAGSIIPQQPVVQSTAFTPQGNLELRVYPGPDCTGLLYLDDGHTLRPGANYMRLPMSCSQNEAATGASLTLDPQHGQFKPWFSALDIVFYGAPSAPKSASLDGKPVSNSKYDAIHHTVTLTVPYTTGGEKVSIAY
jgi:alpha-glucosidase